MDIVIERAKKEQSMEILTVNEAAWYQAYKEVFTEEELKEHFDYKFSDDGFARFARYVEKCDNFYVAKNKDNGRIVGYIDFGMCHWDDEYKDCGAIHAIYVLPQLQKCGIGKKMMNFAFEYFKARGVKKVLLTTFQKNSIGLGFYKHNDFAIEKQLPKGSWHDNGIDETMLAKELE